MKLKANTEALEVFRPGSDADDRALSILLVDDDPSIRESIGRALALLCMTHARGDSGRDGHS